MSSLNSSCSVVWNTIHVLKIRFDSTRWDIIRSHCMYKSARIHNKYVLEKLYKSNWDNKTVEVATPTSDRKHDSSNSQGEPVQINACWTTLSFYPCLSKSFWPCGMFYIRSFDKEIQVKSQWDQVSLLVWLHTHLSKQTGYTCILYLCLVNSKYTQHLPSSC